MRILGLDIGTKSLGIAITDALKISIKPLEGFFNWKKFDECIEKINNIIKYYNNEIDTIVVGIPLKYNNKKSKWTIQVEKYYLDIKNNFPKLNVVMQDEYLTTQESEEELIRTNEKNISKKIDSQSAALIIKRYLNNI